MNENSFANCFPSWKIKEFSRDKVVIYKEEDDFCGEHFLVQDVEGLIVIYFLNEEDNILEILETTEIETKYLTEEDREKLKKGIIIYTRKNLMKTIEDFE